MPVDTVEIKRALDAFTNDNYVDAKEILKTQIAAATIEHLQNKLGLENPIDGGLDSDSDPDPVED